MPPGRHLARVDQPVELAHRHLEHLGRLARRHPLARHGPRWSHPFGTLARVTHDDDTRARALEENRRRSEVMAEAQRYGPPPPRSNSQAAARPHEVDKQGEMTLNNEQ